MKIAVMGAGNGGCAAAADLRLRTGHEIALFNRSPGRIEALQDAGGIHLEGVGATGFADLAVISTDVNEVLDGATIVIVTAPTSALGAYGKLLSTRLGSDHLVFLNPGHMGGGLHFASKFDIAHRPRICETTTLTYACRMTGDTTVTIYREATGLLFAAFPARDTVACLEQLEPLFPGRFKVASSVLETGIQDLNAIEHPAQILCNAGWIEHAKGDYYFYFEGTTPSVARVIETVDNERMQLAATLGVPTRSFVDYFAAAGYTTEQAAQTGSVYEAMQHSEANRWMKAPVSLDHRYVHEDVGWGLVPWEALGNVVGVPMPTVSALIHLACVMNKIDYRRDGLTLERLGFDDRITVEEVRRFAEHGPAA